MAIKLKYVIIIIVILLSSCATMQVNQYSSIGISSNVKSELINAQRRINKQQKIIDKQHKKRIKYVNKLQNKTLYLK